MMTDAAADLISRELAYRETDGLQISLLWHETDNSLIVVVVDLLRGDAFDLPVDGADALDAFEHPFAYAAFSEVPYRSGCSTSGDRA